MLQRVLLLLTITSMAYWLVAWFCVEVFFRSRRRRTAYRPPVSILKPVKGLDAEAYENFESFCRQDYSRCELLFGVSDPSDPAVELIEKLKQQFPQQKIRLIVAPPRGMNPKSAILHELELRARHDVVVISDSDIRVTPDYLESVVAPLKDRRTGMVTCLYRSQSPATAAARLQALYLHSDFLPSAIVADRLLGVRLGLGATIALRRDDLLRAGGYASIADYLADDFQIAARIAALGLRVRLSDYVVTNVMGPMGFREQWEREIRWARGIRSSCPRRYASMWLTFSTPLAGGLAFVSGLAPHAVALLAAAVLLRGLVAWRMLGHLGGPASRAGLVWLPLRDCLTAMVWCAGLFGNRVTWRGMDFSLRSDGRLERKPCLAPEQHV